MFTLMRLSPAICGMLLVLVLMSPAARGQEKTQPAGKANQTTQEVQKAIGQLGNQRFSAREAAQQQLLKAAGDDSETVLNECVAAYSGTEDPEIKLRLGEILKKIFETQVLNKPQGFLGIRMGTGQTTNENGVPVRTIAVIDFVKDSAAQAAGLVQGDLILRVNDFDVNVQPAVMAFARYIQSHRPGETVKVTVKRQGKPQVIEVKLGNFPPELRDETAGNRIKVRFEDWLNDQLAERGLQKQN